ncbi:hypothetical protein ACTU3I_06910 [Microbacterium sp. RD1]|uniref:hypothetical protein n=1 Tax=Microbacterium sp. RD1 TaxID=3457313 RepID=UPI003FA5807D
MHVGEWHPIMAAVEGPTGTWRMVDPQGVEYGRIEIRRVMNGTQVAYKAMRRGAVLGWANTLRLACYKVHMDYLAAMSPGYRSAAPTPDELVPGRARASYR